MTGTTRDATAADDLDQRHEPVLFTEPLRGDAIDDGYTGQEKITAVQGDDVLDRLKTSGFSSGCTILTQEPQGTEKVAAAYAMRHHLRSIARLQQATDPGDPQ
ncbi:hypothetical protein [Catenuloplanes indicus]|uniref:DNA helicase TIP49 (TBP-interacting protein) n=1 Tax=Catenuloplanes indicus TaxID=137267 RepID=A0AAE4AWI3_9ACTN|nr:hypothetical protein [Catenuloplanes indicus]MDQ0365074.1 DNA helicase TIP49 (TBP-interacting protein) [Catenuloplanes indicus]